MSESNKNLDKSSVEENHKNESNSNSDILSTPSQTASAKTEKFFPKLQELKDWFLSLIRENFRSAFKNWFSKQENLDFPEESETLTEKPTSNRRIKLETVFVPPMKIEPMMDSGEGSFEKMPIIERIFLVYKVLEKLNIDLDSLPKPLEGTNTDSMMRQESYVLIEVPPLNKMILVCEEHGNRTFVIYDSSSPKTYYSLKKNELDEHELVRALRWNSDQEEWKKNLADLLSFNQPPPKKIAQERPQNSQNTTPLSADRKPWTFDRAIKGVTDGYNIWLQKEKPRPENERKKFNPYYFLNSLKSIDPEYNNLGRHGAKRLGYPSFENLVSAVSKKTKNPNLYADFEKRKTDKLTFDRVAWTILSGYFGWCCEEKPKLPKDRHPFNPKYFSKVLGANNKEYHIAITNGRRVLEYADSTALIKAVSDYYKVPEMYDDFEKIEVKDWTYARAEQIILAAYWLWLDNEKSQPESKRKKFSPGYFQTDLKKFSKEFKNVLTYGYQNLKYESFDDLLREVSKKNELPDLVSDFSREDREHWTLDTAAQVIMTGYWFWMTEEKTKKPENRQPFNKKYFEHLQTYDVSFDRAVKNAPVTLGCELKELIQKTAEIYNLPDLVKDFDYREITKWTFDRAAKLINSGYEIWLKEEGSKPKKEEKTEKKRKLFNRNYFSTRLKAERQEYENLSSHSVKNFGCQNFEELIKKVSDYYSKPEIYLNFERRDQKEWTFERACDAIFEGYSVWLAEEKKQTPENKKTFRADYFKTLGDRYPECKIICANGYKSLGYSHFKDLIKAVSDYLEMPEIMNNYEGTIRQSKK